MRKLFNKPLGLSVSPFADKKEIAPAIIAAGIAAAASIGSAVLGSSSQASANRKNEELTKDTNKTNYQIWQEQLAAMHEQWNQQQSNFQQQREWSLQDRNFENWYNSPQQQKLRYQQAGFNPALMLEGNAPVGSVQASIGNAPSPNSVPSPSSMVAPHVAPVDYSGFGLGVSNAVNTYLSAERQEADITAIRQRTNNETLETLSKISQRDWQNKEIKATIDRMIYDLQFEKDNVEGRKNFISLTNKALVADIAYKDMRTTMDKAMINSNIGLNKKQIENLQQAILESMNRIYVSNESLRLSSAEVSQRVVSMINHDASVFENLGISKEMVTSQKFKNYVGTVVDAIANGAAIYFGARRSFGSAPSKPYTPPLGDYIGW